MRYIVLPEYVSLFKKQNSLTDGVTGSGCVNNFEIGFYVQIY